MSNGSRAAPTRRHRGARTWLAGLLIAIAVVSGAAVFASDEPDGLEKVAEENGFLDATREHDLSSSPVADYELDGIDDGPFSTAVAGMVGVVVTLVVGAVLFSLAKHGRGRGQGQ